MTTTMIALGTRLRQQTGQPDAGVLSLEFAIIAPFAILTIISLLQLGLYFHAFNVARSGAQLGVQAGRVPAAVRCATRSQHVDVRFMSDP